MSETLKFEKYYSFLLLREALLRSFSLDIDRLKLKRARVGKWRIAGRGYPDFSISHSGGLVCVAVSLGSVGVDIEPIRELPPSFASEVLTDSEREYLCELDGGERTEWLISSFTKKEAYFKYIAGETFKPASIDSRNITAHTEILSQIGADFVLSVCSDENKAVRIFTDIKL